MSQLSKEARENLSNQLVKLGDMLGDGDAEPWVSKEYRRICKLLGYTRERRPADPAINQKMTERVQAVACKACDGKLKQTRSGSMVAVCVDCGAKYQLLKRVKSGG